MIAEAVANLVRTQDRASLWFWRFSNGLGALLESERDRWLIWTPVFVGLGVGIYFSLPVEPRLSSGIALSILTMALAVALRRWPALARAGAVLVMIAVGFLAAEIRTALVAAPVLGHPVGPVWIGGRVAEVELLEKSARVVLEDVDIQGVPRDRIPAQIRVSLTRYSDTPKLGTAIRLKVKLFTPPAPAAPGAHDFRRDLYFGQIGAVGYAVRKFHAGSAPGSSDGPLMGRLRQAAAERIEAVFPGAEQAPRRAIALALLVGERGPIPEAINNAMRDAGLAHLLAISGMNITIAAGLIYYATRLLLAAIPSVALRFPIKKFAAAAGLAGEILYTQFVGAPVSAERSMITTGFLMFAIMTDRTAITLRLVALSATLLILVEPEAMVGASFQMSYGAIVALVVFYERWQLHRSFASGPAWLAPLRYLAGIAIMSIIASTASAVFSIYHFQQSAFYGLGGNLLAEPVHDLWIMPWGIATYLTMPLGLEALTLKPMGWGISAMLWSARFVSGLPGASGHFEAMPVTALVLIVLGGLWFLLWTRRWRWIGLAPVLGGILLTLFARQPDILIAEDVRVVAIRQPTGELALSDRRHDRFTQSVWVRRSGAGDIEENRPAALADSTDDCSPALCRFTVAGHRGVIIGDPARIAETCADVEIAIGSIPLHGRCGAKLVIDRDDADRAGAMAVTIDHGVFRVDSVRQREGARPWTGLQR